MRTASRDTATVEALAWEHYWKHGGSVRCVPDSVSVAQLTSACWRQFARSMPPGGRVLDLGTGRGYVLEEIGNERADVECVGVDSAPSLAAEERRFRIKSGVTMEQLPFAPSEFDGVCSQFAFEYSDMRKTADEVARILRCGGKFQLLIHHSRGIVAEQSARRRAALQWVLEQSGIFEKAEQLTDNHRVLSSATSAALSEAVQHADKLQLDSVAPEIASAIHQIITTGQRSWIDQVRRGLGRVMELARNELVILAALERATLDREKIEELLQVLRGAGLEPRPATTLEAQPGVPFAWHIQALKPSA